jgi:hypothetical protein
LKLPGYLRAFPTASSFVSNYRQEKRTTPENVRKIENQLKLFGARKAAKKIAHLSSSFHGQRRMRSAPYSRTHPQGQR